MYVFMYKSGIFMRSIITIIFLNRQLFVVHTVELNCYRPFVRKQISNYFRLIKRRPLLWNQKGLQITPSPPLPSEHTLWVTICRGRAGPGAPTKMLLHYETRGTSTRTWWEGGDQKETTKSQVVWGSVRGGGG